MKWCLRLSVVLLLRDAAAAADHRATVTPVQKVLTLLNDMLAKGQAEKHSEEVQFATYHQFCQDTVAMKQTAISNADETIIMLQADIQKYGSDAQFLADEISHHDADIAVWEGDIKAATKVREIEKNDYVATHQDYCETIDAIQRAVSTLKQVAAQEHHQATSLVDVTALRQLKLIPDKARKAIEAFVQSAGGLEVDQPDPMSVSAPEAYAYEFQSSGVIDLLEKLYEKFYEERNKLEKEESNTQHAFNMLVTDLTQQKASAHTDRVEKTGARATKLQHKSQAEADLQDITATKAADLTYQQDLAATCTQKASDFQTRQTLRSQELQVIQQAMDILAGNAVAGHADTYLPTLAQTAASASKRPRGPALMQAGVSARTPLQDRASQFLRLQASHIKSRALATIATHVAEDPFVKVKKLIQDLLFKLQEEANQELQHKGWCDAELSTNDQTRTSKTAEVATLHAEIDGLKASIASLDEEYQMLTQAVADLDAAMGNATADRNAEQASNQQTVTDSQEAQAAVAQAIQALKSFYASAATATAFAQSGHAVAANAHMKAKSKRQDPVQPESPEIFNAPYQGMQEQNGGVVGLLEVIESDFARLETETVASEGTAEQEYNTFMQASQVDKAQKQSDITHKQNQKQNDESALTTAEADLLGTQKELDAALEYYEKLKPSCIDTGEDFEERVARREEEIASLQEALQILNGEDVSR